MNIAGGESFDMKRLEPLSNTIFGVAMTLTAYDLPRRLQTVDARSMGAIVGALAGPVVIVMLSFAVAAIFWLSHYRRLAAAPVAGGGIVALNLLFLSTIVLLPAFSGLYAGNQDSAPAVRLYCAHLSIMAGLNAWLWRLARGPGRSDSGALFSAVYATAIFVAAGALSFVSIQAARIVLPLAFLFPVAKWLWRLARK